MGAWTAFAARTVLHGHAGCVYFPTFTRFSTYEVRKYQNRKCFTHPKNQSCSRSANELSSRIAVAGGRVSRRVDPHGVIVWLQRHVSMTQTELQSRTAAALHLNTSFSFCLWVAWCVRSAKKNVSLRPRAPEPVAPATKWTTGPGLGPCTL